jgi:phosphopantothenoylcysteine decarboxylase/phosphopantothenate--cysteine ligase
VIVEAVIAAAGVEQDLVGRSIVVTAGGTREPIDPVRFIGNRSTGRQGVAIAECAARRGADVTLILANSEVSEPRGIRTVTVSTTAELRAAAIEAAKTADVIVMAAAVADYRPRAVAEAKIKKEQQGDSLALELVRNPDILAELAAASRDDQVVIGFAAETEPDDDAMVRLGREKIQRKGCDFLVINRVGWREGFATDGNTITVLDRSGTIVAEASGTKTSVADRILDLLH